MKKQVSLRWIGLLWLLPGSAAAIYLVTSMTPLGSTLGLSTDFLLNCSLVAVPILGFAVILIGAAMMRQ